VAQAAVLLAIAVVAVVVGLVVVDVDGGVRGQ
jgi:hypothetical protein